VLFDPTLAISLANQRTAELMAEATTNSPPARAALLESMTDVCARLCQNLDRARFERGRELVQLLIDRVIVTNDDVEIRQVVPTRENSLHTAFVNCHEIISTTHRYRPSRSLESTPRRAIRA
jgi:hypothetical protein